MCHLELLQWQLCLHWPIVRHIQQYLGKIGLHRHQLRRSRSIQRWHPSGLHKIWLLKNQGRGWPLLFHYIDNPLHTSQLDIAAWLLCIFECDGPTPLFFLQLQVRPSKSHPLTCLIGLSVNRKCRGSKLHNARKTLPANIGPKMSWMWPLYLSSSASLSTITLHQKKRITLTFCVDVGVQRRQNLPSWKRECLKLASPAWYAKFNTLSEERRSPQWCFLHSPQLFDLWLRYEWKVSQGGTLEQTGKRRSCRPLKETAQSSQSHF